MKFPLLQSMEILYAQKMRWELTVHYVAWMAMTSPQGQMKIIIVPTQMVSGTHLILLNGLTVLVRFIIFLFLSHQMYSLSTQQYRK